MSRRNRTYLAAVALVGLGSVPSVQPLQADDTGLRLGPVETVCVEVPEASPGDVALTNATAVETSAPGFVTAHNEDINPWAVSSVNFGAGDTVPNLTATVVTADRRVCLTSSAKATLHMVVDLFGVIDGSHFDAAARGGERILDTRESSGQTLGRPVPALGAVCVNALGALQGAAVAVVNVTITEPSRSGFVSVRGSTDITPRSTSTHNFAGGQTVANLTVTDLAAGQELCAYTSRGSEAHVIFDVIGWLDARVFDSPGQGPTRILDSRLASGPTKGQPVGAAGTLCTPASSAGFTPAVGGLMIANVAVTEPTRSGYATVHGGAPGSVSTHNFGPDQTVANLTAVPLASDRALCATASRSSAFHIVADLAGVIASRALVDLPDGARRLLDTRELQSLPGRYGELGLRFEPCDVLLERLKSERLVELAALGSDDDVIGFPSLPPTNGNSPVSVPEFSTTNTQDEKVDEGDLVETDGRYLFTSVVGDLATPATELHVIDIDAGVTVAVVVLAGAYPEMILHEDRLIVTTSGSADDQFSQTTVTTFDVTTPTSPTMVDRYGVDGTRVAMRSVGGIARTVLNSYRVPGRHGFGFRTVGELRAEVANSVIEDWLPRKFAIATDGSYGSSTLGIDCADVGVANVDNGLGVTWVVEEHLDSGAGSGPEAVSGVVASAGRSTVMASRRNLYIATEAYVPWGSGAFLPGSTVTRIHLFETSGDRSISYAATGEVPGRLLNQFAMGEHEGILRVAVTSGWWNESSSSVFALRKAGSSFERISAVTDLAAGESIFAVRHIGATSYVVTFRQTDPLFVIDFNDPAVPVVRGELKIPGFSSYLHPVGPGVLLGVGQDADTNGRVIGAQLSLFDVSNPADPRRIDTLDIEGARSFDDHREFLFWAPTGTIALPAYSYETDRASIAVARIDGNRLHSVGEFAETTALCGPDRTVLVGDELLAVGRSSTTIADAASLAVRVQIGTCR